MRSLNRREFLTLSASSLLLIQCGRSASQSLSKSAPVFSQGGPIYRSQNGKLNLELTAQQTQVNLGSQYQTLLTYNGQIPGPRLEAKPGDTVQIQFQNRLNEPTNLHFHGLHIPPTGEADNVFRHVNAGETALYRFTIPDPHPGGLAYYHPHLHGHVADQILGGLGGLFVVRGALDQVAEVHAAQEIFLFLKDFMGDRRPFMMGRMAGREGDLITVNGQLSPQFEIPSGGLVRLRIVNASNAKFYRLALEGHPFYLIATDGHALADRVLQTDLLLSPGERADVLFEANQRSGAFPLWQLPYERGGMGMMGGGMMGGGRTGRGGNRTEPEAIATFTYQGKTEPQALPSRLIDLDSLAANSIVRQFALNHGMVPGQGMVFLINGKTFDPNQIDTTVRLASVEDWEIVNTGVMDHPFHLHTNAFQVIERNGQAVEQPFWKDTVLVPRGERVRIRIPFRDYVGKTVYHCHILDHEELGMMGIIEMQNG